MADKSTRLMLDALTRAAAEPDGLPLYARKGSEGLFPFTTLAKSAADRCTAEGFLELTDGAETAKLSEAGMKFLLDHANPKQLIEDFLRVVESRQTEIDAIAGTLERMRKSMDGMTATLREALPSPYRNGHAPGNDLASQLLQKLQTWRDANAARDCPLPRLYQDLAEPKPTIGQFHDALRKMHDLGKVAAHPWTGPLYDLPEPKFALLIGHEIAYYVAPRE